MSEQLKGIKQRFESMKELQSFKKLLPTDLFFNDMNFLIQQAEKVEVYERELDRLYGERYKDAIEDFDLGDLSDGYHTFNELYYHRMMLFAVICNTYKEKAWKSKLHADGTMYDNYFIVGVTTDEGDYTYHYHLDYWDYFNVSEIPNSPEWDGHKPEDITRLLSLVTEL